MSAQAVDRAVDLQLAAEAGVRAMLELAGENPDRSGLHDTPARVVRAFLELTAGRDQDPAELLSRTFDDVGDTDEMIHVGPVEFVSVCEHHLLPFVGHAHVAYKPEAGEPIVGLSKLARLVDCYARRPQVQERLTAQITTALVKNLSPNAACVIRARHECMSLRGVGKRDALMTTSSLRGLFREDGRARAEFLALAGLHQR